MSSRRDISDWVLTLLVDAPGIIFSHDPWCIGAFELSRKLEPLPGCEEALARSAREHSVAFDERTLRIRTFFIGVNEREALRLGRLYAKEALILFARGTYTLAKPSLLHAGCLLNLLTGSASPVPRKKSDQANGMGMFAMLDEIGTHPSLVVNTLLSTSPETYGELGAAVRRSSHWSHAAAEADDHGERLLLQWMAAETLTREKENECLTPKLMAAAGFPSSRYEMSLPAHERVSPVSVPDYLVWKRRLTALFDKLREARNDIAHSGFRELDLGDHFSEDDRAVVLRAFPRVVSELQGMALNALQLRIRTIREMWVRYGECYLLHRPIPLAQHLTGNFLYSLTQDADFFDE